MKNFVRVLLTSVVLSSTCAIAFAAEDAGNANNAGGAATTSEAPAAATNAPASAAKKLTKQEVQEIKKSCNEKNKGDKVAIKKCIQDTKKEKMSSASDATGSTPGSATGAAGSTN